MEIKEELVFNNALGSITNKRIILNLKSGSEEVLIKDITALNFSRKQNIVTAGVYFAFCCAVLISIAFMPQVPGPIIVIAILLLILAMAIGVANYIGNYFITISVAGKTQQPIKIEMAKTKEGKQFTQVLQQQMVQQ